LFIPEGSYKELEPSTNTNSATSTNPNNPSTTLSPTTVTPTPGIVRQGLGKQISHTGNIYNGFWESDKMCGKGKVVVIHFFACNFCFSKGFLTVFPLTYFTPSHSLP
jgi:meiotically up-regulated gene 157 (Mug157) protein